MEHQVLSDSIASGASTSGGIAIAPGAWKCFQIQVGTMSTAAEIAIQNSVDNGATYYRVFNEPTNTTTVGSNLVTIASAVGTNGGLVALNHGGYTQLRFLASAVVSGGVQFKIICTR